jgi:hypothetical protein
LVIFIVGDEQTYQYLLDLDIVEYLAVIEIIVGGLLLGKR